MLSSGRTALGTCKGYILISAPPPNPTTFATCLRGDRDRLKLSDDFGFHCIKFFFGEGSHCT